MRRLLVAIALLVCSSAALAQNSINFDLDLSDLLAPELTWSTSPAGATCTASGAWSGSKASSGTETVAPIRTSSGFAIACSWPGDSMAMLTWVNPTTNTDGSAYDPLTGATRLVWSDQGNLDAFDCLDPAGSGLPTVERPGGQSMHTVADLTPGTWEFRAFAVNSMGLCSAPSNTASKTTGAAVSVNDSITVTVPNPITLLDAG